MTGLIAKSADVMRAMNNLVRLPELNNVMMTMSREMEKVSVYYWPMVVNRINKQARSRSLTTVVDLPEVFLGVPQSWSLLTMFIHVTDCNIFKTRLVSLKK
jgi:hypothetical protein